jgi:hypothetical protein
MMENLRKPLIELDASCFSPVISWRQVVTQMNHDAYMTFLAWLKDNGIKKFDEVEVDVMERFLREWKDCRKYHAGRWHRAECAFPYEDEAVCTC